MHYNGSLASSAINNRPYSKGRNVLLFKVNRKSEGSFPFLSRVA